MHVVGWLPPGVDDCAVAERASASGIDVLPISAFALEPSSLRRSGLLLGYGALDESAIREGVRRLAAALRPLLA